MRLGSMASTGLAIGIQNGQERVAGSSEQIAEAVQFPFKDTMINGILAGSIAPEFSTNFIDNPAHKNSAISAQTAPAAYSPASYSNASNTDINPVINITLNGVSNDSTVQDIAEKVKLAIQEVFESAARRQGIAGVQSWQL